VTTALVISGGGSKGAFAVGAIEEALSRGLHFDIISGTSTGALIAPLLAIDDIDKLVELYTTVKTKDILRLNWRRFFLDAIYDTRPLEKLIRRTMQGRRFEALQLTNVKVLLCSVGFQTGNIIYGTQHPIDRLREAIPWEDFNGFVASVLASTNQPMLMPPSVFAGETCFDGGVREVAPLQSVLKLGVERAFVIANSPVEPRPVQQPHYKMVTIGPRAIDLMTTEILNNDISYSDAEVVVIRPEENLPSNGLKFVPEEMQEMRRIGREMARRVLDEYGY